MTPITLRRSARVLALLTASGLALAGCASAAPASSVASDCAPADEGLTTFTPGTLTVGVPENPPYTQTDGSGGASGIEIDVIEKLAAAECLALSYVPITYANGIPMITEQKKTDIITGGWYVTPTRAEQVGFTTPTMYDTMGVVSKDGIDTVDALESVGTVGTGTGFSWNEELAPLLGSKLQQYPGTVEMKQDLVAGRIQAALDGYAVAVAAYADTDYKVEPIQADPRVSITQTKPLIAFPVSKDNTALSDALSALIDQYRTDGTLADLLKQYDLPSDLLVPADVAATSIR
ncbi:polar amino acid transport system substrate-binding protein [Microbacterium testaceum]|uniref:substrate-binding periplasmic protein n=1 Tax=Microbacterium TaxID=33882 RepID=UPI00277D3DB8|nr:MULTISPECIES: transporter substrate-binding domain-containing protein [Microbacterium]MDQ1112255.1 polar amino acid transport system substrate-binding protein [Microbacterium testaceum]MDR6097209.1 polar amino acid transport system substrate-binding protein [Microbacterium sp. SORGH_AS_0454]